MAKVTVRPLGASIEAPMGSTVLQAALRAGVDFPNSCQSGNCGACKCALVAGEVDMMPYSPYALSDEERSRGLILACRAMAWEDCEVAIVGTSEVVRHPLRRLACTVAAIERATHDIAILRLRHDGEPMDFSAGQFAKLDFGHGLARDYSMANPPGADSLEFHIRRVPGGMVSGQVWERLREGDGVTVEGPFGDCWLRQEHAGPIVCIAGGSGLAPIKSIVETALRRGMSNPLHLYFGVRGERDVYLEEHFRDLAARHPNLRLEIVLSEPAPGSTRRRGFVTAALKADRPDLAGGKAYVCGPPPMVDAAMAVLAELGVPAADRHADAFYTQADRMPAVAAGGSRR